MSSENVAATPPQQTPEKQVRELEALAAEYLAGWQRARADYQNLKKECAEKQARFLTDAREMFLEDVLPIYDNLKRALAAPRRAEAEWRAGIERIKSQWDTLLRQWRVEPVPTTNEPFDPNRHEAVEREGSGGPEVVVREVQGGYLVNGRLLYPAKVVVGPAPVEKPPHSPP